MTKTQANEPGFVLVPREPTEAMLRAGWELADFNPLRDSLIGKIYRAMLSSAPIVPAPAYGVKAPTIKPLPDQNVLQDQLLYDPATGLLHRKSGREAGKEAFTFTDSQGYRHGKIGGVKYQAHRIIWKLVHGVDPDRIDHINGDPSDNRLVNLRSCTVAENSRNYAKTRKTRGYRGVSWVKRDRAWAARISDGSGGKVSLGNHKTAEDAARAYDKAARQMHGEFAVLNFPEEI